MREKVKQWFIRNALIFMAILMLLMVTGFVLCHVLVRKSMIRDYNAVVGRAYTQNAELAEQFAELLYSQDLSSDDVAMGQQAMKELGYTSNGMQAAKTYDVMIYAAFYIAIFGMIVIFFFLILCERKRVNQITSIEKERISRDVEHSHFGERQFLEKKNRQTQRYVENVAHQVRTPLTNIMLNLNMVYDNLSDEDKAVLDECNYHAQRINVLMDRLLKIGRLEAGKVEFEKQPENLHKLLTNLISSYQGEKRISYQCEEVSLYADYDWLYEAIKCLVDNSLEHIGMDNHISVTLKQENNMALLRIEDDGAGLNEEDIPNLFERFYSKETVNATGHYGIGLNLARLIIEGHYGTIKAYNREKGGAGFYIELPQYKLK